LQLQQPIENCFVASVIAKNFPSNDHLRSLSDLNQKHCSNRSGVSV
jgi:hypothetical protein